MSDKEAQLEMDIVIEELGEAILGLLAGGAVIAMFAAVLSYVTSF